MFTLKQSAAAVAFGLMALATTAQAVTLEELKRPGPFTIVAQPLNGDGYGAGTLYAPNVAGKYPLMAICPGFVSPQSSVTEAGKKLAQHGYAVVAISTLTLLDFPPSRANQILAALKAGSEVSTGNAAGKIDTTRLIASGWSMGGGGTLLAAARVPTLKAAIAYAPWNTANSPFRSITVPSLIFAATGDIIAPTNTHSVTFYNAIPASTPKVLAVLKGDNHFFVSDAADPVNYTNIAFAKRFVENNSEYTQFLKNLDPKWARYEKSGF